MHLAFLTPEYPHSRANRAAGIGTSIKNMAVGLAKKGIEISVFIYGQQEDAIFKEGPMKIHLIKQRSYPVLGWYLYRKFLQKYLNNYIALEQIDAVEAPDWTGIAAFMKLNCPVVIRMNGSDAYFCNLEGRKQKRKNFWFEKKALMGADHLLSVSKFTAEKTTEIFNLKKPIEIIPNSVNIRKFSPLEVAPVPNSLLYFGSIIRKKGILELAFIFNEVVKENPDATLTLLGKDVNDLRENRSTLEIFKEKLSSSAKNNIKYTSELPYDKMQEQLALASVIVLPSFAEALPMTWLEAMAMEKALVTSNIGWAKEVMINGETGFTENPKNHKAYAEKILNLLQNPKKAQKMGINARKKVEKKFSAEVVAEKNMRFYETFLNFNQKQKEVKDKGR